MERDARYSAIKILIETKHINSFLEIFNYIPKSKLGADLRINNNRITRLINQPDEFSVRDLSKIASFIGVDPMAIIDLVLAQIESQTKPKQAKKKGYKKNDI